MERRRTMRLQSRRARLVLMLAVGLGLSAAAVAKYRLITVADSEASSTEPSLTIYNQNFAVIRQNLPLDLHEGANAVRFTDVTAHAETDSVILRDPAGSRRLQVLEQSYR